MNLTEKLNKVNNELDTLRSEHKKLLEQIAIKVKDQEKLMMELNSENLNDFSWLLRNPTMPGVHKAIRVKLKELYGGEYNGPHIMGYHHDGKHNPIQANVHFSLNSHGSTPREKFKENCEHFIENFLHVLEPVYTISSRYDYKSPKIRVVPFLICSDEGGLDYLGYCSENQKWYYFTTRYGNHKIEREFETWDEAFDFAYKMANYETEENEDY